MNKRRVGGVFAGTFLISLLLLVFVAQAFNDVFSEARRSVLICALENSRGIGLSGFVQSSDILLSLKILGIQDGGAVDAALQLISSKQDPVEGGYIGLYGANSTPLGADLASTYYAVHALKALNALNRVNQTLLIDFVLNRHNSSSGAFHELETKAFNRTFAWCGFPMVFHNGVTDAYAIPNVISSFFAVSILKDINALSRINVTRTLEWVVSDQSSNGGFKPYPYAETEYLPGWSSLIQNPFTVDDAGAGVPYTYAATGILKNLEAADLVDREKARDYVLSCQSWDMYDKYNYGRFAFYRGDALDTRDFYYTYYAILALSNLGMINETSEAVLRVNDIVLGNQLLGLDNHWPVPMPQDFDTTYWPASTPQHNYGLFLDSSEIDLFEATREGLEILNATGGLSLLNQPTPRTFISLLNITALSALISGLALLVLFVILKIKKGAAPKTDNYATESSGSVDSLGSMRNKLGRQYSLQ